MVLALIPCLLLVRPWSRGRATSGDSNAVEAGTKRLSHDCDVSTTTAARVPTGSTPVDFTTTGQASPVHGPTKHERSLHAQSLREQTMLRALFDDNMKLRSAWEQLPVAPGPANVAAQNEMAPAI